MIRASILALGLMLAAATAQAGPREDLNWPGPYQGLVPCADCAGIVTLLELSPEGRYRLYERYEGRQDTPVTAEGSFSWDAGSAVITLDGTDPPRRYGVGAGRVWMLDLEGRVITGNLAEAYVLTKAD